MARNKEKEKEATKFLFDFFDGDISLIATWLDTKNPMIGNITPLEMIKRGRAKRLVKMILAMKEGDFP